MAKRKSASKRAAPAPREIELKLSLHPDDAEALARHLDGLVSAQAAVAQTTTAQTTTVSAQRLVSRYFDTPNLDLMRRRLALRMRRTPDGWVQTLKGGGAAYAGLHARDEWEVPSPDGKLMPESLLHTPHGDWLIEHFGRLSPVFTVDVRRRLWTLELGSIGQAPLKQSKAAGAVATSATADRSARTRIEVALDLGKVRSGKKSEVLSEVELELLQGDAGELFGLAKRLMEQVRLRPDSVSKAARGYRLAFAEALAEKLVEALKPVRPTETLLDPQAGKAAVTARVAEACIAHWMDNDARLVARLKTRHALADDPEYIHQLRVALRRLRTAIRLFKPAVDAALMRELRWIAAVLGEARDADVFMLEQLPGMQDVLDGDYPRLLRRYTALREHTERGALAALASARYARLMLRVSEWLWNLQETALALSESRDDSKRTRRASRQHRSSLAFARERLARLYRPIAESPAPDALDPAARHALRIHVKHLRYATEFFSSLFDQAAVAAFTRPLRRTQDALGQLNDNAVATDMLRRAGLSRKVDNRLAGWLRECDAAGVARASLAFGELRATPCFWRRVPGGKTATVEAVQIRSDGKSGGKSGGDERSDDRNSGKSDNENKEMNGG